MSGCQDEALQFLVENSRKESMDIGQAEDYNEYIE